MAHVAAVVLAALIAVSAAQTCDNSDVSQVIHSDITSDNAGFVSSIGLAGGAAVSLQGIDLTSTSAGSYGGFFFNSPTAFQGDGGFSAKFAIQASGGSGGEAWEFVVADSGSRRILPAPYAVGSASHGLAGWSRANAMVIEFDALNSGPSEQDNGGADHIAMYLGGAEVCQASVGTRFANGNLYYIWIDFIGFSTTMEVRVSSTNNRPPSATVACGVDMWGTMDIGANNHVGFTAYNPAGSAGAAHTLREVISLTDAYRPEDTGGECAYYTDCALRSVNSLCTTLVGGGVCSFKACPPVYAWTVGGGSCCAFVEKSSYRATGPASAVVAGGTTTCARTRVTVVYKTENYRCRGVTPVVTSPGTTTAAITAGTTVAGTTAAGTTAAGTTAAGTTAAGSTKTLNEGF
jgi:hypothetical protein